MNKTFLFFLNFISAITFSSNVFGDCESTLNIEPSFYFPGNVIVQRDAPVGSVIASGQTNVRATATKSSINGQLAKFYVKIQGFNEVDENKYNGKKIFKTNLSGVGFTIDSILDEGTGTAIDIAKTEAPGPGVAQSTFDYYLIKTGTIEPGILNSLAYEKIGYVCLGASNTNKFIGSKAAYITGTKIQVAACDLVDKITYVPMGKTSPSYFNGVGSVDSVSEETPFTIKLDCEPSTNVRLNITGNSGNYDEANGILNIDSVSSGSGIGIQLLYNKNVFPLKTTNLISTSVQEGIFEIEMAARYVQTSSEITPGKIQATANLILTYQ